MTCNFIITIILILFCAIISSIETAITAAVPSKVMGKKYKNKTKIVKTLSLLKKKDEIISTLLIIFNTLSIIVTIIVTKSLVTTFGENRGTLISSIFMSTILVLITEILPKTISISKCEIISVKTTNAINILLITFKPITFIINAIIKSLNKLFKLSISSKEHSLSEEIDNTINYHYWEGNITNEEKSNFQIIMKLQNTKAEDIMHDIKILRTKNISTSEEDLIKYSLLHKLYKIPIWQEKKDNIVGILNVKQFLINNYLSKNKEKLDIKRYISKKMLIIKKDDSIKFNILKIKESNISFIFVLDRNKKICGFFTKKDIPKIIS